MKMISPDSIAPETRSWFGNQIQNLAMRHDLAGPAISRVRRGKYIKDLVKEFRARAVAAIKARELVLSSEQMDVFCREAAKELIDLRQTRADHQCGKLPAELMRHLPNNLEILSHVAASLRRVVDDSLKEMEEAERTLPSDTGESGAARRLKRHELHSRPVVTS